MINMKAIIAVFAIFCIAVISSEMCFREDRCQHVSCDSGWNVACVNHECTCTQDNGHSCYRTSDCHGHCSSGWHCVDNRCMCRQVMAV